MICLKCGWCCKHYFVPIPIDPDKPMINEEDPDDTSNIEMFMGQPEDKRKQCPHLRGDKPGEYWCYCHDKPWYNETPCADFTQVEMRNSPCRTGTYVMNKENEKHS